MTVPRKIERLRARPRRMDRQRLSGRVAVVTGAGSGIGQATAERFAMEGAMVVCADIDEDAAKATSQLIEDKQGVAKPLQLDVSIESEVEGAIQQTVDEFSQLDILFNNAGIGGGGEWGRTIDVNLSGVYYGLLHGAPHMIEGGGVILNTASIAGLVGLTVPGLESQFSPDVVQSGIGSYVAAKHGVVGLTKQFALQYGGYGIRVNAIAPGYIRTAMTAAFMSSDEIRKHFESLHPMGRLGEAHEIASAAAFLASDDASFISGIVLPVDGGYTAR